MLKNNSFRKTVTSAGTAEKLHASLSVKSFVIRALESNTGIVYLGSSGVTSANGFELPPGGSITEDFFEGSPITLTDLWLDVVVSGEGVSVLYLGR